MCFRSKCRGDIRHVKKVFGGTQAYNTKRGIADGRSWIVKYSDHRDRCRFRRCSWDLRVGSIFWKEDRCDQRKGGGSKRRGGGCGGQVCGVLHCTVAEDQGEAGEVLLLPKARASGGADRTELHGGGNAKSSGRAAGGGEPPGGGPRQRANQHRAREIGQFSAIGCGKIIFELV